MIEKITIPITDFLGGLNTRFRPDQIADNQLATALNCQPEGPGLTPRGGTVANRGTTVFGDRITSLALLNDHTNGHAIYATSQAKLWRWTGGGSWTDVSGGLTFPSDTLWDWTQFNDVNLGGVLIGVNRGAPSDVATVIIKDSSSNAVALGGTPPDGRFIVAANHRVFIVPQDSPDQIDWCALGDAEDYTTTTAGISAGTIVVGDNVKGDITGIYLYRDSLLVFYATKTYEIDFGDTVNTDERNWSVKTISEEVGCLSQKSIKEVMGDLVFLSSHGIISLQGLLQTGDKEVEAALLSSEIKELRGLPIDHENYPAEIVPGKSQYIISITSTTGSDNDATFVFDFEQLKRQSGPAAWYQWDGNLAAESFLNAVDFNSQSVLFIGSKSGSVSAEVYNYDLTELQDSGSDFAVVIRSKVFNFATPLNRKKFYKVGASLTALDNTASVVFGYLFDENMDTRHKTYNLSFEPSQVGDSFYGTAIYGTSKYGTELKIGTDFMMRVTGKSGRLAKNVQLELIRETDSNFILNAFEMELSLASRKYITSDNAGLVISRVSGV